MEKANCIDGKSIIKIKETNSKCLSDSVRRRRIKQENVILISVM